MSYPKVRDVAGVFLRWYCCLFVARVLCSKDFMKLSPTDAAECKCKIYTTVMKAQEILWIPPGIHKRLKRVEFQPADPAPT